MKAKARIAIIGGGWSGLSCAEGIARTAGSNAEITLIDIAPQFGGRARGLLWEVASQPLSMTLSIDNGQHLTLGAYTQTFELLKRVGAPQWESENLVWSGVGRNGRLQQQWVIPNLAWPWRLLATLIGPYSPKGWPLSWRWSLAKTMASMMGTGWTSNQTVADWLAARGTPPELIEHFWRPLAEGALNTEINAASASTLMRVIKDSLAGGHASTQVRTPQHNLSVDGVNVIIDWLGQHNVTLLPGHQAIRVEPGAGVHLRSKGQDIFHAADLVVLALPADRCEKIWQTSAMKQTPASLRWPRVQYRAITTIWIACDVVAQKALSALPSWFVFNPVHGLPHIAQVGVQRPGVLALVISAQHEDLGEEIREGTCEDLRQHQHQQTNKQLREQLHEQLHAQLGIDISTLPQKWITEKKATWAATLNHPAPSPQEIMGHTGVAGVFRAADDLEPGYPATIESAVRSGQRTAKNLLTYMSAELHIA